MPRSSTSPQLEPGQSPESVYFTPMIDSSSAQRPRPSPGITTVLDFYELPSGSSKGSTSKIPRPSTSAHPRRELSSRSNVSRYIESTEEVSGSELASKVRTTPPHQTSSGMRSPRRKDSPSRPVHSPQGPRRPSTTSRATSGTGMRGSRSSFGSISTVSSMRSDDHATGMGEFGANPMRRPPSVPGPGRKGDVSSSGTTTRRASDSNAVPGSSRLRNPFPGYTPASNGRRRSQEHLDGDATLSVPSTRLWTGLHMRPLPAVPSSPISPPSTVEKNTSAGTTLVKSSDDVGDAPPMSLLISRGSSRRRASAPEPDSPQDQRPSVPRGPDYPGSRRTSYHVSSTSLSSRSSGSQPPPKATTIPVPEPDPEPSPELVIDLTAKKRRSKSSSTTTKTPIISTQTVPPTEIPRRTSSNPNSPISGSPIGRGPSISPRKSSILEPYPSLLNESPTLDPRPLSPTTRGKPYGALQPNPSSSGWSTSTSVAHDLQRRMSKSGGPGLMLDLPGTGSSQARPPPPPIPARNPLRANSQYSTTSTISVRSPVPSDTFSTPLPTPTVEESGNLSPPSPTASTADVRPSQRRRGSKFFELDEDRQLDPSEERDEVRFTAVTFPSMYPQDSVPNTAATAAGTFWSQDSGPPSAVHSAGGQPSPGVDSIISEAMSLDGGERRVRRKSRMDDLWGKKKDSKTDSENREALSRLSDHALLPRLAMPETTEFGTLTQSPMSAVVASASTQVSQASDRPALGHSPASQAPSLPSHHRPVRSPSAPSLGGPVKMGELPRSDTSETLRKANEGLENVPLLPSAMTRSPTAPSLSLSPASPKPVTTRSKRSHLIREIAATERAYATDLALVRDAYLTRYQRTVSTSSLGDSPVPSASTNTLQISPSNSRPNSQVVEANAPIGSMTSSMPRTPSGDAQSSTLGYFTPASTFTAGSSTTSFHNTSSAPFPWESTRSSVLTSASSVGSTVGKPLSPADVKVIFSNLELLTAGAEDMATALEKAVGEQDTKVREGEGGDDRLGEAFVAILPRLRPLYLHYCSRQSAGAARLIDVFADAGHAAFLRDCWSKIRSRTHAWNLDSMLIKPVQRITKYPLLFDDLLASTTPVHEDYFNIRSASQMARQLAVEIDEAKRRKELVAFAIATKRTAVPPPMIKEPSRGKGLKLWRKDKSGSVTSPVIPVGTDATGLSEVSETSMALMKELAGRLDESEKVIRQVGKDVVLWTAGAKEMLFAEDQMIHSWSRVVQLDENDSPAQKILALRSNLEEMLTGSWATLNEEVRIGIMPVLAKLLETMINPRKVIQRRDARLSDYVRYLALRDGRRTIDKLVRDPAEEFIALHTQLVVELPTFLEGVARILDIAIVAFAQSQAKFHLSVRLVLDGYKRRWIAVPRKKSPGEINLDDLDADDSIMSMEIVRTWREAWLPYAEAMDHFSCTRPGAGRIHPSRVASFNKSTEPSRSNSPTKPSLVPPQLSHSSSFTSKRNVSPAKTSDDSTRRRSASLLSGPEVPPGAQQTVTSPVKESRFNLLRGTKSSRETMNKRQARPSSMHLPSGDVRYSFGLPKFSGDTAKMFEGLSLSSADSTSAVLSSNNATVTGRVASDPQGLRRAVTGSTVTTAEFGGEYRRAQRAEKDDEDPSVGLGLGHLGTIVNAATRRKSSATDGQELEAITAAAAAAAASAQAAKEAKRTMKSRRIVDAAEGWKTEPVLYQCACVASFDVHPLGDKKYRGLRFLTMDPGDLFDVFYEVGRIDELSNFPYPEIGVENDGILVGRGEDQSIGLMICSFLEPLY